MKPTFILLLNRLVFSVISHKVVHAGLVEEDCVAKMRMLSLVDLASDESGKIPYASIKTTLQVQNLFCLNKTESVDNLVFVASQTHRICWAIQVNDEEVELWVVKAITAKLVDCKMDQMNQVVLVRQASIHLLLCWFI